MLAGVALPAAIALSLACGGVHSRGAPARGPVPAGMVWRLASRHDAPARVSRPVIAYVANGGSDTVTPIRTATNTAGKAIRVGQGPDAIAITPDGRTVYVVNGIGTVSVVSATTNKVIKVIRVGAGPGPIAITPDGKTVYVANTDFGIGRTVTAISTADNKVEKTITVGLDPESIAITPNGKAAYVLNQGPGTVTPIRVATNTAGKAIKVPNADAGIVITPTGRRHTSCAPRR